MRQIELKSYAKINLGLDVIRKREDGYHEVDMVMQTVDLYDTLTLKKTKSAGISIECNMAELPKDGRNLAYQAVELMQERYKIDSGVSIQLEKTIPVAAGMAGGSSNCATALEGMNQLFELGLSNEELRNIGVELGADVPYCILKGTARAQGIGERLTVLPAMPDCFIVIAKPRISVSTRFVYESLRLAEIKDHPRIDALVGEILNGDLEEMCNYMENILETVTIPKYPIIREIQGVMEENGASKALMSGSGPTVFGIFSRKAEANQAMKELKEFEKVNQLYLTKPVN